MSDVSVIAEMLEEGIICESCHSIVDGEAPGDYRKCEECKIAEDDYACVRETSRGAG